jgi:NAD(P)-dependent dehydrogenase (short-subunit alcohol dehydrogenase family)
LNAQPQESAVHERIRKLLTLEDLGSLVLTAAADVTNLEQMRAVLADAEAQFGRIHGVIHAAGIAGGGVMQRKSAIQAAQVLGPKVRGTQVLLGLLKDRDVDFLALCSSVNALLGGLGQVDYCAANAYLDAVAQQHAAGRPRVVSINWDTWAEVGMAVNTDVPSHLEEHRRAALREAILPDEGVKAFERVLQCGLPQVVVSTRNWHERIRRLQTAQVQQKDAHAATDHDVEMRHARPELPVPFVAPRNAIEQRLASVWEALLGMDRVGVDDDFFELGGDSVIAIQVSSRSRQAGLRLSHQQLFEHPTIRELAKLCDAAPSTLEETVDASNDRLARPAESSSEFPAANLNRQQIDRFLASLAQSEGKGA